jgi:N-ethylmaleimide reductase
MGKLLEPVRFGELDLKNKVVMAPMTRARATNPDLVPTELMVEYYGQRAGAGLIITEGTWISREALGFMHAPGIFTEEQIEGWKKVTKKVHQYGGKIFLQIIHAGGAAMPEMTGGVQPIAPSAVNVNFQAFSPAGFKPTIVPKEMTLNEIKIVISEYISAATNAKIAGFDGVEIHGAMVYLIPEFLNPNTNLRTDKYGGNIENRCRFVLEVMKGITDVLGPGRAGIKLSPAFVAGAFWPLSEMVATYEYLLTELNQMSLSHIHLISATSDISNTPFEVIKDPLSYFRPIFRGNIIAGGGYDQATGEQAIESGMANLVAYGKAFIANPDLVERLRNNKPLAVPDPATFYQGGANGLTTYPVYS